MIFTHLASLISLILHSFKDIEELLFNGILDKIGKYLGHQM